MKRIINKIFCLLNYHKPDYSKIKIINNIPETICIYCNAIIIPDKFFLEIIENLKKKGFTFSTLGELNNAKT